MKPSDQMVVLPFASALGPMTGPTTDLTAIASAIDTLQERRRHRDRRRHPRRPPTRMEALDGRHIFVLFTDGYDEHSRRASTQAMEAVRRTARHALHRRHQRRRRRVDRGREALKQLADRHRRQGVLSDRDEELPLVHDRVAADVASRYLLTYTPTNQERDGQWREVQRRHRQPGAHRSARARAISPPRRRRSGRRSSSSRATANRRPVDAQRRATSGPRGRRRAEGHELPGSRRAGLDGDGARQERQHARRGGSGEGPPPARSSTRCGPKTRSACVGFSDGAEMARRRRAPTAPGRGTP